MSARPDVDLLVKQFQRAETDLERALVVSLLVSELKRQTAEIGLLRAALEALTDGDVRSVPLRLVSRDHE